MDRITRVRIKNVRAIEDVELVLGKPLTVLIGENGSGKSTILECLELLRRAAEPNFMSQFYEVHRGMPALLRKGATSLTLGVTVEDDAGKQPRLDYQFTLQAQGAGASISAESLNVLEPAGTTDAVARTHDLYAMRLGARPERLTLAGSHPLMPEDAASRLRSMLSGIEVHLGFDTRASWAARADQRPESLRVSLPHSPAPRLNLLDAILANAWSALRNRPSAHWEYSLALVRLGLGERVDNVLAIPDAGGGNIHLALRFKGIDEPIFAADLSDGQLSWLAFVAMTRLHEGRSLLAVDETALHLHPALLGRVVVLLQELSAPSIVATHADRVLELLDDPIDALRVCEVEHDGQILVSRLDAAVLPRWLQEFGDLGGIRAAGYLSRVVEAPRGLA